MDWRTHLRAEGYAHFPGLVPAPLVEAARAAIDEDLRANYDPSRQHEYDARSSCPGLLGTPPIMNLIGESPVSLILEEALGLERIDWDKGQVAIRRAHNHPVEAPPEPHIDGFAGGLNGLEAGRIYSLTALVGVFITPVRRPFAGNFVVWPGSHYAFEEYFRGRGERAMREPMPVLELGEPTQLLCGVGDAVLFHYQLGHTAAVNTSDDDRVAVYFRIWLRGLEQRRWHHLVNIWDGWKL